MVKFVDLKQFYAQHKKEGINWNLVTLEEGIGISRIKICECACKYDLQVRFVSIHSFK